MTRWESLRNDIQMALGLEVHDVEPALRSGNRFFQVTVTNAEGVVQSVMLDAGGSDRDIVEAARRALTPRGLLRQYWEVQRADGSCVHSGLTRDEASLTERERARGLRRVRVTRYRVSKAAKS